MLRTLLRRLSILSTWAKFTVLGMPLDGPYHANDAYYRQARHLRRYYNMHINPIPVYNPIDIYNRGEKLNLRPVRGAPPRWAEDRARSRVPLP